MKLRKAQLINVYSQGSNVESVEVTEEAVKGMSGPTFYYAEVNFLEYLASSNFFSLACQVHFHYVSGAE